MTKYEQLVPVGNVMICGFFPIFYTIPQSPNFSQWAVYAASVIQIRLTQKCLRKHEKGERGVSPEYSGNNNNDKTLQSIQD